MMKKKFSLAGSRMRALVMLPAAAALVLLASAPALAAKAQDFIPDDETKVARTDEKIFQSAETMPEFPGGDADMFRWISRNIRYPEQAAKNNIQGRVTLQFVVEKDGSVGDVKIVRGVDPELDAEAVRVVKTLPKFKPATMNGEPVRVWYAFPIMFKLAPSDEKSNAENKDVAPRNLCPSSNR